MDELEAAKAKQLSLRERMVARRQQRENILAGVLAGSKPSLKKPPQQHINSLNTDKDHVPTDPGNDEDKRPMLQTTENKELAELTQATSLRLTTSEASVGNNSQTSQSTVPTKSQSPCKTSDLPSPTPHKQKRISSVDDSYPVVHGKPSESMRKSHSNSNLQDELENLLVAQTAKEQENERIREEILELLNTPSVKERYLSEKFRSQGGSQVQQFCAQGTRIECARYKARHGDREVCTKLHFRKLIQPHTDESLGDCSFLNTCFHVDTCKYVHYTIDYSDKSAAISRLPASGPRYPLSQTQTDTLDGNNSDATNAGPQSFPSNEPPVTLYPPQWINCDIRLLNMSILGKFAVIMADPPWDIHMELPYGTMSDDEMRRLDIPCLQDDGYLFLWVTGRAMELGRECLRLWGYQRVDEIIWVKTNQLQRLIRTGRTGHWLNHGKEHCLVGVKGNPQGVNRGLDCDVIVSEVRETSHKPDEIYGIIERLSPGTRKLELFGRPHNLQPNWITLGNQLDGTYLVDPAVVERFKKQYPNGLDVSKS